jgi:hypothetical protein
MKRRWHVIADLVNQHGLTVGAEIGVAEGRFSAGLLSFCPDVRLWAIDDYRPGYKTWMGTEWDAQTQQTNNRAAVEVMNASAGRMTLLLQSSLRAAEDFAEGELDFVFIDADHAYEAVKADITAWRTKIRPEGWITGHDYDLRKFPGVVRAVEESFADFTLGDDRVWMARI